MALKVFVTTYISTGPAGGPLDGQQIYFTSPIFEDGQILLKPDTTPYNLSAGTNIQANDTSTSIRAKLRDAYVLEFNTETSRTDGALIEFVWLDKK